MGTGLVLGIVGSSLGVMGGVIGTYFSIRNTKRPRERSLMIRLAAMCWVWFAGMLVWMFLIPRPWNQAAMLFNLPILFSIPRMNRRLALARAEDEAT
ncbi:hypothetical protein [Singulisphaera sp. GP187]|uniref:hypothetical protein n=1 Tax=Singulisphaera sp. GP187 TaxID=1882752 RepID=UPI00116127BF|nr:hypothetical protein [Singulisphaera sp. GP187]